MIRLAGILMILLCFYEPGITQGDSLTFASVHTSSRRIAKGVFWHRMVFKKKELFGSNQYVSYIVITPKGKRYRLSIERSDSLEKTSLIAAREKAIAAINGSFFKMRGPDPDHGPQGGGVRILERSKADRNRSVVYFRENDSLISENIPGKDSLRKRHQQGAIIVNPGTVSIVLNDPGDLSSEHHLRGEDILSTGPVMILGDVRQPIPPDAFCNDRHPRTALGLRRDGAVLMLVVDGRMEQSEGMSIPELQKIMHWLGCVEAINLDGGGSTTMYVRRRPFSGVVNHPSDNRKFDHEGEREVANALLIIRK